MTTTPLPILGAAMPSTQLDQHMDWLMADARDLEIQDFAAPDVLDNPDFDTHVEGIRQKLDGYPGRVGVHAPFWNLDLAAYDRKIRAVVQDRLKQAVTGAAHIGATHMVIHSPLAFLGAPGSLTAPSIGTASLFDVVHETLAEVVRLATDAGVILVIENIFDHHPLMLTDLVRSFGSPNVRQSLDVGHAYINYLRGAPPPDYYIKTAGDLLAHLHLQDTDGYSDRHWAIGQGKVDFAPIFAEVAKLGSNPRLMLELRNTNAIQSSAAYLAALGLAR